MKLCRRLLVEISAKNDKFGYLNPILGKLGVMHDPSWIAHWKAHGWLSIRVNWTFFAIYYGSRVIRWNVYSSAVSTGGRPLCTQILPGQSRPPSTTLGKRKLETLRYLMMKTASHAFPHFDTIPQWWTDRQTDGYVIAYTAACKASFAVHCNELTVNFSLNAA